MTLYLKMPGLSGMDVLKAIRNDPELAAIKIIVVSAMPEEDWRNSTELGPPTVFEKKKILYREDDPSENVYILGGGLIKTFFFGYIIALMGCYFGFSTKGGAEGVGQSTMKAVVSSCLLILVANYLLASLIFRVIFTPSG